MDFVRGRKYPVLWEGLIENGWQVSDYIAGKKITPDPAGIGLR